jgi:hypothetical protein
MNGSRSRFLLVEGQDDLRVVPYLVESAGMAWGPKSNPIVRIQDCGGVDELLSPGEIEAYLKASSLDALGVLVDADESAEARWAAIRSRVLHRFPDAPISMDPDGIVLRDGDGLSFGAWIMPDNINRGMMETFLMYLRPAENDALLALSRDVAAEATLRGAPYRQCHADKAQIHSWLAWQDPPGLQLHIAVLKRVLTNRPECWLKFIAWFCRLYGFSNPMTNPKSDV